MRIRFTTKTAAFIGIILMFTTIVRAAPSRCPSIYDIKNAVYIGLIPGVAGSLVVKTDPFKHPMPIFVFKIQNGGVVLVNGALNTKESFAYLSEITGSYSLKPTYCTYEPFADISLSQVRLTETPAVLYRFPSKDDASIIKQAQEQAKRKAAFLAAFTKYKDKFLKYGADETVALIWGLTEFGFSWQEIDPQVQKNMLLVVKNNSSKLTPQDLVKIVWALAGAGCKWEMLGKSVQAAILNAIAKNEQKLKQEDAKRLIWALKRMGSNLKDIGLNSVS